MIQLPMINFVALGEYLILLNNIVCVHFYMIIIQIQFHAWLEILSVAFVD